jgi:hypothetical protein
VGGFVNCFTVAVELLREFNSFELDEKKLFKSLRSFTEMHQIDKTLLTILSVTGIDMSHWKSARQFAAWLRLSPRPKKSANKVVGYDYCETNSPATQALRMCAQSLHSSKSPLGCLYRKLTVNN